MKPVAEAKTFMRELGGPELVALTTGLLIGTELAAWAVRSFVHWLWRP